MGYLVMPRFKSPKQQAQAISQIEWQTPFFGDDELDKDIEWQDKAEVHYPSHYEPGYKDFEDPFEDNISVYPTNKKGFVYVVSNFMGDGYTTPERISQYVKQSYPYNRREWEKENR